MNNPFSYFDAVILTVMFLLVIVGIFAMVHAIVSPQGPTLEEIMEWDFRACEQMRASGWTEKEIKDFMESHDGYYDKDYE